jgi:hypothetical protein
MLEDGMPCDTCSCDDNHEQREKIDYLFDVAKKVEKLVDELGPQVGPILASVAGNPMLKMFMR